MSAAWQALDEVECNQVWDRFEQEFDFTPSVRSERWPGILEPSPSETYCISAVYDGDDSHYTALNSDYQNWGLHAFQELLPSESEWLYVLDWQHPCYKFFPQVPFELDEFNEWTIPIVPDGDYHIFLERNLRWGIFGHPWEQTVCIFGAPLLMKLKNDRPTLLATPLRTNGQKV